MERSILQVKRRDKVPLKTIKSKLRNNEEGIATIWRKKWDWVGHVARWTIEDGRIGQFFCNLIVKGDREVKKPGVVTILTSS